MVAAPGAVAKIAVHYLGGRKIFLKMPPDRDTPAFR
jgi:hypothetical protein